MTNIKNPHMVYIRLIWPPVHSLHSCHQTWDLTFQPPAHTIFPYFTMSHESSLRALSVWLQPQRLSVGSSPYWSTPLLTNFQGRAARVPPDSILPGSKSPKLLHSFLKSSDPISQINLAFLKKKHSKMISRHSRIELRKGQRKTMLWRQLQRWSSWCGKVILPGLFVVLHPLCKEPLIHSHPRLHLTLGWDHLGAFSSPRTWTHFS